MIGVFKDNGRVYLITVPYFTRFYHTSQDTVLHEDNVNVFKIPNTNTCLGYGDMGLECDLLKLNSNLFSKKLDGLNVLSGVKALREIYDSYDLLDSNGEMVREMIICDNENIYNIDTEFKITKIESICFTNRNPSDFNYIREIMDAMDGSIKERVIKAISHMLKEYKAKNSKIYIINTMDDEVEVIDLN